MIVKTIIILLSVIVGLLLALALMPLPATRADEAQTRWRKVSACRAEIRQRRAPPWNPDRTSPDAL